MSEMKIKPVRQAQEPQGKLPEGWEVKKLGDVCNFVQGIQKGVNLQSDTQQENQVRFLRIVDFTQGNELPRFIDNPGNKYILNKNDVSLVRYGASTGFVCRGLEGALANNLFRVIPKYEGELKNDYLYTFLTSPLFQSIIKKSMNGAAMPAISFGLINDIQIFLPPLPEQKRIVSILDKAFAEIEKAESNAQENLKNAKELFESYLRDVLSNKKWKIKPLGDLCIKVEYGSSSKSASIGDIPVLRMGNIQNGRFNWDNLKYSVNEEENVKYLLKYNDVLFNRTNSPELVGKTAIYKGERPAIFAGYLIRIHRNEDLLDADFLNYYLNSQMAMDYGKTIVISSVNQANINGTKLKGYPIPSPPLIEQKTIVKKLDTLSSRMKNLGDIYQKKIADLEELKKSVLQKAFRGEF